jgi:hypothetical protein
MYQMDRVTKIPFNYMNYLNESVILGGIIDFISRLNKSKRLLHLLKISKAGITYIV